MRGRKGFSPAIKKKGDAIKINPIEIVTTLIIEGIILGIVVSVSKPITKLIESIYTRKKKKLSDDNVAACAVVIDN